VRRLNSDARRLRPAAAVAVAAIWSALATSVGIEAAAPVAAIAS
jgi:hypothetical protein